ncbi:SPOCS domain-containing protein [Clostridium pasteurianum]|uniref:Uncharacterized protein n=1 Tax=Clostridium pasteurianum BC1 TaxID=86416 RepID=R4K789_CLOPA|nr:SPOCS domain-containing protein [Clostridium pasteurianum]AGK98438.1 hypothetical protein Clopa_3656 [Clostridium pasteurianum BC1]
METNLNPQGVSDNNTTKKFELKSIGKATRQDLIEREIIFDAPKKDAVLKVINIQDQIEIKDIKVTSGTILVSGYLNSCIIYTTMKRPQWENNSQEKNNENANNSEKNGYVNMGNSKSSESNNNNKKKNNEKAKPCCGVVDNSIALDGVIRHTTVWIPFKSFIPVPEVQEQDICSVTSSAVLNDLKSIAMNPIYEDEYDEESTISIIRSEEEHKFIKGIVNKTLIELTVDIKRYAEN